jgi:hypothetical protein
MPGTGASRSAASAARPAECGDRSAATILPSGASSVRDEPPYPRAETRMSRMSMVGSTIAASPTSRWGFRALALSAVLLLAGAGPLAAQVDVIRGRVTTATPDNTPIFGARVTATSLSGNVRRTAATNNDGRYTITFPGGDGDYWIDVSALGFTSRRFELKRLADEAVLIADARLATLTLDTIVVTAGRPRPTRRDSTRDIGGTERTIDPTQLI